jgi:hypothetical protein
VSLGDGLPSSEGGHGCLVPLLSYIASKPRARKGNPKREKEECEMAIRVRRKAYL